MKLREIFKSRKVTAIIVIVIALSLIGVGYYHSVTTAYEIKLITGEMYVLRIGWQPYILEHSVFYGSKQAFLTITSGIYSETRNIGFLTASVGKTFKFLDLEVYIEEALVDGIRIIVRKW